MYRAFETRGDSGETFGNPIGNSGQLIRHTLETSLDPRADS